MNELCSGFRLGQGQVGVLSCQDALHVELVIFAGAFCSPALEEVRRASECYRAF